MDNLVGGIALIYVVGIVIKLRVLFPYRHGKGGYGYTSVSEGRLKAILLSAFILYIGYMFIVRTYFDFLFLEVLCWLLVSIWVLALFLDALIPGGFFNTPFPFSLLIGLMVIIWLGLFVYSFLPNTVENLQGISDGPQFAIGTVQQKSARVNRGGPLYYMDINDTHYHVPDGKWWRSVNVGDEIPYAYNPAADDIPNIFHSNQIALTLPGLFFIGIICTFWLLTTIMVLEGYISRLI